MRLIKKFSVSVFLSFVMIANLSLSTTFAASLYSDSPPADTDLDGLTDQGEIQLFNTDPTNPDTDNDTFLDGTEIIVGTNALDPNDPPQITSPQETTSQQEIPWVWYLMRVSGITSYLLLFILMISGLGITSGFIYKLYGPIIAWRTHRAVGIILVAFIAIHLATLLLDKFMNFSFADVFIPFHSEFSPLYMSYGIIGLYLLILIILTSIIIILSQYKLWRLIHFLTFPAFVLLFLHGVLIGTDTNTLPMQIIYWSTGIITTLAFIYRIIKIPSRRSRDTQGLIAKMQNK